MSNGTIRETLADAEPFNPNTPAGVDTGGGAGAPFSTPSAEGGNGGPATWDGDGLPGDCPVKPIGVIGVKCVFLDAQNQLILAGPRELGNNYLTQYFSGNVSYLMHYWPTENAKKYSPEDCCRGIQKACAEGGIWDDMERVRGRGAWRRDDGSLVYHCGDVLIGKDGLEQPGVLATGVYPAGAKMRRPLKQAERLPDASSQEAAGWKIMEMVETWNWKRGVLDARLFFGLMMAGFLGGALDWRPSGWVTGEKGSGKSYLQALRRDIMGSWSLNAADATAAGIFQRMKFDALAVSLDEQEAGADNRKLDAMVELAREAASSDLRLRGSSSHEGVAFQARSSFMFSSINPAALKGQDMSRMTMLDLYPLKTGAIAPRWTKDQAAGWGRELLRVCLNRWDRFDKTLEAYREELGKLGHDSRGQDTFGTLLACADLALCEHGFLGTGELVDDDPWIEEIWRGLAPSRLQEYADIVPNWLSCIEFLLASRPRDWKTGTQPSIGAACAEFIAQHGNRPDRVELKERNQLLALGGVVLRYGDDATGWQLFVPNRHPQLSGLFEGSDWPGRANAPGGWGKAMRSGPAGYVSEGKFYIDGVQQRGSVINLSKVMRWSDEPSAEDDQMNVEDF